jgi:membrane-bound ClpP family serine protease
MSGTYVAMERGLIVVVSGLFCSMLLWLWLQRYLPKLPYLQKLVLMTSVGSTTSGASAETGTWPTIGATGRAVTDLRPGGKAAFHDPALGDERITQVVSDSGFVIEGSPLIVREVAGNRVVVRTIT